MHKTASRSGKPGRLFSFAGWILCAIMMASVAIASAQVEKYRSVSATQISPGLRAGVVMFTSQQGAVRMGFVEATLGTNHLSAEAVCSPAGPLASARLEDLAAAVGAKSLVGIDLPPPAGAPKEFAGVYYSRNSLLAWPAADRWHLTVFADGACMIEQPAVGAGRITFGNGATLGLMSINGELPTNGTMASVYTGRLGASDSPIVEWPRDVKGALLVPVRDGVSVNGNFLPQEGSDVRFRVLRILERDELKCGDGQALLVFRDSMGDGVFADAEFATIAVDFPAAMRPATFTLPIGDPLMINGALAQGVNADKVVMNVIAVDGSAKKLIAFSPAEPGARGPQLTAGQLVEYLRELKYTRAHFLSDRQPALLADAGNSDMQKELEATRARTALAFVPKAAKLQTAPGNADLFAIKGIAIQPLGREFPANMAGALTDLRSAPSPDLTQFWAVPFVRTDSLTSLQDDPNTLLIALPKPTRVGALEIVNAEAVGFSPQFDLKHFRILGRAKKDAAWQLLKEKDAESPAARYLVPLDNAPILLEMRLQIVEPNFLPQGDVARISELIVWGTEAGL